MSSVVQRAFQNSALCSPAAAAPPPPPSFLLHLFHETRCSSLIFCTSLKGRHKGARFNISTLKVPRKFSFVPNHQFQHYSSIRGHPCIQRAESEEHTSKSTTTIIEDKEKSNVVNEENSEGLNSPKLEQSDEKLEQQEKQEIDWKNDEDFKKFMGNPSIETALKLEKKRAERRLKDLENRQNGNIFENLFSNLLKNSIQREKERLDRAEETFRALDLNKLRACFGYDSFYATDVRRFGDGGIFVGNLRRPLEEVKPKLKQKLSVAAEREIAIWFLEENVNDTTKQVCLVQPKAEVDLQFETSKLSNFPGYLTAALLGVTTLGTISIMSGFFLKPDASFDDYVARVLPLFGGFLTILGVSEIAARWTAARYDVKLSPSFLIPSNWTGCLGVVNNFESILPNRKALFDIAAARITSSYVTSFLLALVAFALDGALNGGDNALYIRPQFFYNNPLLSFVQYVIGPYSDELGNVLPQALEGVGVPVDPLAFAGLLGVVVTSLNLLPCGKLEGGRIVQALFGRKVATVLSFFTSLSLGIGGLTGSILCLVWGFVATFFRGGEELPAEDEITPIDGGRYLWGYILAIFCFLTLFPNSAGTFPSAFYTPPFFRGENF